MRLRTYLLVGLLTFSFCLALNVAVTAQEEVITNDEVISLTKAGLASSVIIAKIKTSRTNFDLSTDALIKLKQAGVTDDTVGAMLEAKTGKSIATDVTPNSAGAATVGALGDPNDPMAKHNYGVYLYEEKDGQKKMTLVKPTVSAQNRTGGMFTSSLTYGISKVKIKTNLPGRNAALQIMPTEFRQGSVVIDVGGAIREIPNDFVWIFAGGIPPTDFLKATGIAFGAMDVSARTE